MGTATVNISCQQMFRQRSPEIHINTAYSTFGKTKKTKKKSLKIIDWSHRFCLVSFCFAQTTFFIAQYTGRKWKWTNREDSLRLRTFWLTTVKQKHSKKKKGRKQLLKIFRTLLPLVFLFLTLLFSRFAHPTMQPEARQSLLSVRSQHLATCL